MSAHTNNDAQNHIGQMMIDGNDDQQNSPIGFFRDFLDAVGRIRAMRRRKLAARRAGAMSAHLRRDLGFEAGVDMEIAVKASAPAYLVSAIACPLANHDLSPHDWPVTSANDNVSWQPKRSWLALA
jgi:hypothetical protein